MRIYKTRFYVLETVPGISGFQRWNERERRLCTGHAAVNHRPYVIGEYQVKAADRLRLENGRLPEYQPILSAIEAMPTLTANPYMMAFFLP